VDAAPIGQYEKATITGIRRSSSADDERNRLLKIDDDRRTAKEQGQRDAAYAVLAAALAAKKAATRAHVEAMVAYNDALTAPLVKVRYSKKVSGNNDNHVKVDADITTKKDLSNSSYLTEEAEFVIKVREAVKKLGKGALVEVNSGLMTQEKTKEKPAVKDHGKKKTQHEGNVKHQGQTIAKETARSIATKKKSVADHHDASMAMYLEEENIAKMRTERGVLAKIKTSHGMCDSEGHHPLRSSGSGTALLQCVDTTRKGEWEDKRMGFREVYPTGQTKQASYTSSTSISVNISFILRKF
jgi:hypothetical protein